MLLTAAEELLRTLYTLYIYGNDLQIRTLVNNEVNFSNKKKETINLEDSPILNSQPWKKDLGNQHPTNKTSVELYCLVDPAKCGSGRYLEPQKSGSCSW